MRRQAVGFYWTLPVPWAGFTKLPDRIDEAAEASRTILYQREAIRRYAKDQRYQLIHEEVFLEIEPDRGSEVIHAPLNKVEKICRAHGAVLLFVDFSAVQGWRSHGPMADWSERTKIAVEPVPPDELRINGKPFDPHAHFGEWRKQQQAWTAGKPARAALALARARELRDQRLSYRRIAETLNAEDLPNMSGKPWSADNLRKFLTDPPA